MNALRVCWCGLVPFGPTPSRVLSEPLQSPTRLVSRCLYIVHRMFGLVLRVAPRVSQHHRLRIAPRVSLHHRDQHHPLHCSIRAMPADAPKRGPPEGVSIRSLTTPFASDPVRVFLPSLAPCLYVCARTHTVLVCVPPLVPRTHTICVCAPYVCAPSVCVRESTHRSRVCARTAHTAHMCVRDHTHRSCVCVRTAHASHRVHASASCAAPLCVLRLRAL